MIHYHEDLPFPFVRRLMLAICTCNLLVAEYHRNITFQMRHGVLCRVCRRDQTKCIRLRKICLTNPTLLTNTHLDGEICHNIHGFTFYTLPAFEVSKNLRKPSRICFVGPIFVFCAECKSQGLRRARTAHLVAKLSIYEWRTPFG